MNCTPYYTLLVILSLGLLGGCSATSQPQDTSASAAAGYEEKSLGNIQGFAYDKRSDIVKTVNVLAARLERSPYFKSLKHTRSDTFKNDYPVLELIDRNADGKPDEFAYLPEVNSSETLEYGFMFDLNKDGKIDYIVLNGGPAFSKDAKAAWVSSHWIDSNDDGRVDIVVYNNSIDLNGDDHFDKGVCGWVYDTNCDGSVDKAEYLDADHALPVKAKNGSYVIKTIFGDQAWGNTSQLDRENLGSRILSDINTMISGA